MHAVFYSLYDIQRLYCLSLSIQLHLTAPSLLSALGTRPHPRPPTPKPHPLCPLLPPSRHLPAAPQLLSNIIAAHRLLLNSHSIPLFPLPLSSSSSSPLLYLHILLLSKPYLHPPTRVRCLHKVNLLFPQCPRHSSPSLHPSPLSLQHLHLSVNLPLPLALRLLPQARFHLKAPLLALSLVLFLLLAPL